MIPRRFEPTTFGIEINDLARSAIRLLVYLIVNYEFELLFGFGKFFETCVCFGCLKMYVKFVECT
jgi:hypothetical protein